MSVSLDLHSVWHSFVMEKAGIVCRTGTQSSSSIAENTLMHSYLLMDAYKLEVPTENTLDVIEQGGSQRTWISCRVRLLGTAQPSAITPRPGCGPRRHHDAEHSSAFSQQAELEGVKNEGLLCT